MPKCENGHSTKLGMACEVCGSPVLYSGELDSLASIPVPNIKYEETSIIFCGVKPFTVNGLHSATIEIGKRDERLSDRFTAKYISGGTWLDYARSYARKVRSWLKLTGAYESRFRLYVVNAMDPLSVAVLSSLKSFDDSIVFALMADGGSTPVEQNTSYVAYTLISNKKLPAILAKIGYVNSMSSFTEEKGLATGISAFETVSYILAQNMAPLADFLKKDLRLGITLHSFYSIIGGSNYVFKSPSSALSAFGQQLLAASGQASPLSAYLVGAAEKEQIQELSLSFSNFSKTIKGLFASGSFISQRQSAFNLYDIILIFGIKGEGILEEISKGYDVIRRNAPDLGAEKLEEII